MAIENYELAGFNLDLGIEIIEWEHDRCVMELAIKPRHRNRSGAVHGGVISTLIDAAGSHAGNHSADPAQRPRSVTVALTTQFLGQAKEGTLRAVGTRTGGGRRIFFSRVVIYADDGTEIACGDVTGRRFS
jgi:uncharacterized protein (TIGR00369 family)